MTCLTIAKMPELDSADRIAILTEKIGAMQKRYTDSELKAEVAYLDRKKRRAKQREREGEYT